MGKTVNNKGKAGRVKDLNREKYWKFGKTSGNPEATKRRNERKAERK